MKTRKVLCAVLAMAILVACTAVPAMAEENIKVVLNGTDLEFDVAPQMISDRVLVPMRKIFESLGAEVYWDDDTQTIIATKSDVIVIMQINNPTIFINGEPVELDVPPQLVGERTLVPVRAVAEGLNAMVTWDDENSTVIIIG